MRGDFTNSTIFFNITSLLLVCMAAFNILTYENKIKDPSSQHNGITLKTSNSKPDIYYIVLDGYPRADILKKYYNYDNSLFLERLESLGFNILEKSQSNYNYTLFSIRSTLEMEYIDNLFSNTKEYLANNRLNGLRRTKVLEILYNSGYKTNAFKTGFYLSELNNSPYIKSILENHSGINPFDSIVLKTTAFLAISQLIPWEKYYHRERQLFILDSLPKFSKEEGPNFVFAHIMCPHQPFIFDVNGDWVNSFQPKMRLFAEPPLRNDKDKELIEKYYCNQITYLNNRILRVVESILKNPDKESVIIIQSDHSDRTLSTYLSKRNPSVMFYNLSAIYLPNGRQHEITPDASNVNTFRYVFNHAFNTKFPILPNKHYFLVRKNKSSTLELMPDFTNDFIK